MLFLKYALALIAVIPIVCVSADAETLITGYIGSHKRSFRVDEGNYIGVPIHKTPADYLAITELYPDVPGSAEYRYSVSINDTHKYELRHRGIGFGPETHFVRVHDGHLASCSLFGLSATPIRTSAVWQVTKAELDKLIANDNFRILGIANATSDTGEKLVEQIAKGIAPLPKYNITTGFSAEVRYANQSPENVRKEIERCANWSRKYSLPAMIGLVSWWSGTPLHAPDGEGGRFGDIKYQQICYTPDTEQPEDENLKALLGDRYNRHYCLSIPNQWSSTPWLTMNSEALNNYRYKRLAEAIATLKDVCQGDTKWIDNLYLENEPRYWDRDCEAGNNKRKPTEMWADFNPLAVAAAKKDGVELDPQDGLSNAELLWLFRNVGRYNQETVDAASKALKANGLDLPLYTHSLQHKGMFPGGPLNHPASEWAYAVGARTGLEGMWTQPSDFARVREWGRWANVNREENDGRHIDEHLWDLRVTYMMGADLYNSYNWDSIGEGRFFAYVKEFLDNLPVVILPAAGVKQIDDSSISLQSRTKMQAFTSINLPAVAQKAIKGTARLTVTDSSGNLIGMSCQQINASPHTALLPFEFAEAVQLPRQDTAAAKLEILDENGKAVPGAVKIRLDADAPVEISLDLVTQRALSLAVIARASATRPASP